jgi:hypothetical protein
LVSFIDSNTSIVRHRFSTVNYGEQHLVDLADNAAGGLIMDCWSCGRKIPDAATFCPYCEAHAEEEPTAEEKAVVADVLKGMGPDAIAELCNAFEQSKTGEEFVNRVMVGDCPKCGSSNTRDCENDLEIDDITVARCLACGQLWCPFCGELLKADQSDEHDCPVLNEIDLNDEDWEDAD